MTHRIHALDLKKDIVPPANPGTPAPDGTLEILPFRSLVAPGNLEPKKEDHLVPMEAVPDAGAGPAGESEPAVIRAGSYLFTQAPFPDNEEALRPACRDAAEALWLEALWRNLRLKNDRILVRILSEDGKKVFQAFREIET